MTPKTNPNNCETGHCEDHSGLLVWMQAATGLCALAVGLLSFSVFWQAPNIRMEIVREIARLDAKDVAAEYRMQNIEKDVRNIMTLLEK